MKHGIILRRLWFMGPDAHTELELSAGLNVLFGASNTGKSFAVKGFDFMLGGSRVLPDIGERRGYDRAWLAADLPKSGTATLARALAGGQFEYYAGTIDPPSRMSGQTLSARHDAGSMDNLSQLLLAELDLLDRQIAVDANGKKRGLSFRDLARFCIVDETAIQSEVSPALSGQPNLATTERSVFRLLITGNDDSALATLVDRKTFSASTGGKMEVVDELIAQLTDEIAADFPDAEGLLDQAARLEDAWRTAQAELDQAQGSIQDSLAIKRDLADNIVILQDRAADIEITIARFEQLADVYGSDVRRLQAIEEAGFLLSLGSDQPCPVCGARPEHQLQAHGLSDVAQTRAAADAEIEKILLQEVELGHSIADLDNEGAALDERLTGLRSALAEIENYLEEAAPRTKTARLRVQEVSRIRDHVNRGLALLRQREALEARRTQLQALKPAGKKDRPNLTAPAEATHDFAQKVAEVLTKWQFPGERHVTFDESTFDLKIDGKHRRDNGKGVRAVTHAAFKVGLLLFCRERGLPHPGFLILDTPLLTYRDPIGSKAGPLSPDEAALQGSSLKDFFFSHLSAEGAQSQFLVVENVELPSGIGRLASVEVFTGRVGDARVGLF